MGRKPWFVTVVLFAIILCACAPQQSSQKKPANHRATQNFANIQVEKGTNPQVSLVLPRQMAPTPTPTATTVPAANTPSLTVPSSSVGPAPYGQPPAMTAEETQLTQQLFALINSDRASRGLYAYTWNATLAAGARLHSWNMIRCGFSHTCPDGLPQCTRIANEGFAGFSDCGENIAEAGPYPTAWGGVYNIQEGMVNEPPTGWHRIHLFSTTLHRVGVGVVVDSNGWIWFTEDMVS